MTHLSIYFPSRVAEAADIINLDEAFFHFECFTEGAVDGISVTPMGNDGLFEGPELIGFTLYEASNIDGAMVFGNTVEIVIDDAGEYIQPLQMY